MADELPGSFLRLLRRAVHEENPDAVIIGEVWEDASNKESYGQRRDLAYLMALYLMGPIDDNHETPLPPGTRIYSSENNDGIVQLELSEAARSLSDAEFSMAGACLALTCFEVSDCIRVNIVNGDRTLSLTEETLTMFDTPTDYLTMEELP